MRISIVQNYSNYTNQQHQRSSAAHLKSSNITFGDSEYYKMQLWFEEEQQRQKQQLREPLTSAENKLSSLLMVIKPQEERLYEQIIDLQDEIDIQLSNGEYSPEIKTKSEKIANLYNKITELNKPILDMKEVIKKESAIFNQKCLNLK